ncbi:oligosaccharide flippase family protein [Caldithrix abyssi]
MTFLKRITASREYRQLIKNFFNFTIFQLSNYLIPLITIPYIIRIVGVEKFGIISIAQAVGYYFRVVVEYGFPISGVQYVAQNQAKSQKLSEIYSNVIFIQIFLMLAGLLLLLGLVHFIPGMHKEWQVYLFAYGIVPANILMALWFYIGIENMKYLNYINSLGRLLYLCFIFLFIQKPADYVMVPLFNSMALFMAGLLSLAIVKFKFKIRLSSPDVQRIKYYLQDGWSLFVSNFAINFYRNINILILSLFTSKEVVGVFAAVEKVVKVIQTIFSPLTRTLYPFISRITSESEQRAVKAISGILKLMSSISLLIVTLLVFMAPLVVKIVIGQANVLGETLLRIGSLVILFGVVNYILGIIFMTNFNLKTQFSRAVVIAGGMNVLVCVVFSKFWGAIGTVIAWTMVEALLFVLIIWFVKRNSPWNVLKFFLP